MRIYLVRHGQCDSNASCVYNRVNEDLNEVGVKQAEELRNAIKDIDYDVIISSPLTRAVHTSNIINVKNKEVVTDDRLVERKHGSLEGKPIEVTNRQDYWNYYSSTNYGGEERIPDLCKRVRGFLDELKTKDYKSVLVVAHRGISRAFYVYFNGIPTDGAMLALGLDNAEVKEYEL